MEHIHPLPFWKQKNIRPLNNRGFTTASTCFHPPSRHFLRHTLPDSRYSDCSDCVHSNDNRYTHTHFPGTRDDTVDDSTDRYPDDLCSLQTSMFAEHTWHSTVSALCYPQRFLPYAHDCSRWRSNGLLAKCSVAGVLGSFRLPPWFGCARAAGIGELVRFCIDRSIGNCMQAVMWKCWARNQPGIRLRGVLVLGWECCPCPNVCVRWFRLGFQSRWMCWVWTWHLIRFQIVHLNFGNGLDAGMPHFPKYRKIKLFTLEGADMVSKLFQQEFFLWKNK